MSENTQERDVMKEALGILDDLKSAAVSNKEILEEYSTRTGIEPDVLKQYRSCRLTEGRGWDDNPLEKSEEKVSHPDVVSFLESMNPTETYKHKTDVTILNAFTEIADAYKNSEIQL